jgi:hypothetical protein
MGARSSHIERDTAPGAPIVSGESGPEDAAGELRTGHHGKSDAAMGELSDEVLSFADPDAAATAGRWLTGCRPAP